MNSFQFDTVIIGAGPAGLAASLRLRKKGHRVLVIEKNSKIGGKLDNLSWQGYRWDKGPSLFTDPDQVIDLFRLFNREPLDYFDYIELNESCRYFDQENSFILFRDKQKTKEQLSKIFEAKQVDNYYRYLKDIHTTNEKIGKIFIENPKLKWYNLLAISKWKLYPFFLKKKLRTTLDLHNASFFKGNSLHKVFNRFGTYNGSDPRRMSGIYSVIPNLELNEGSFFPIEGMRSIVDSLYNLATEVNIDFLFEANPSVSQSEKGYLISIDDKSILTKNVICAIDHLQFYKSVFKDTQLFKKYDKYERSTSGIVFYWAMNTTTEQFGVHNIIFSDNYNKEFREIFDDKKIPEDPTVYVHISSKVKKDDAPEGGENWFVMINTPAGIEITDEAIDQSRRLVQNKLEKVLNKNISSHIIFEDVWQNAHIEKLTGSVGGAIYGPASNELLSTFKRHDNKSEKYKNVYFVGGTVHPGGGIPLVLRSAKIVSDLIE